MSCSAPFIAFTVQVPWESGCKPRWIGGRGRKKVERNYKQSNPVFKPIYYME